MSTSFGVDTNTLFGLPGGDGVAGRLQAYVKGSKTDAADTEAICEAVSRPNMRFVPVKNPEQQALLAVHRALASFVKARTTQANQMRGLLAECKAPANPSSPSCLARKT